MEESTYGALSWPKTRLQCVNDSTYFRHVVQYRAIAVSKEFLEVARKLRVARHRPAGVLHQQLCVGRQIDLPEQPVKV